MSTSNIENNSNNGAPALGLALLEQAAALAAVPTPPAVKITRVTTDHWFNPKATVTIYLSDGLSRTLTDCTLLLVGVSTSNTAFADFECKCDDDLTALASADFTESTKFCPALKYDDLYVLLGNLTVVRNCIGQTMQKGVKKAISKRFTYHEAFLNFVYRRTSPLIIAVVSEYYEAINHSTKKVSQSSHGFLRLVDSEDRVQPYAEDGEAPRVKSKPASISASTRKLLNVVSDATDDGAGADDEPTAAPRSAKKAKKSNKVTSASGSNNDGDDGDNDSETVLLASGRAAVRANIRSLPAELEASYSRVAAMFEMGNLKTTTLKCNMSDEDIGKFMRRTNATPMHNRTFNFTTSVIDGGKQCIMDAGSCAVDFPHNWLATYEPLLDNKAFCKAVERSLGAVVQNTLRHKDNVVPDFLASMTPRQHQQQADWRARSPLAMASNAHVRVDHVASGITREAMRCLIATKPAECGQMLAYTKVSLALTLPDLLAFSIGHRLCGIQRALSLPNNITANFLGQDASTPFFLFFGSMKDETGDTTYMNFVGDAQGAAANAEIHYDAARGLASLHALRDIAIETPIVVDRGDLFRNIYATISGNSLPTVVGGIDAILAPRVTLEWLDQVSEHVTSASSSTATTTTTTTTAAAAAAAAASGNTEEACRQRALEFLDPHHFDAFVSSAPTTPKKRRRDYEYQYSEPQIINVFSPNCSPKMALSNERDFTALFASFSDEAGFNDCVF